jgi:hypothetical protein
MSVLLSNKKKKLDSIIGMARVMEDYASQESGELSLHKGGIINVYQVIDDEWARGEINGKVGKYPTKVMTHVMYFITIYLNILK